jgi:threonine dehydrogenase-like Zn-dependent dehydrogenase
MKALQIQSPGKAEIVPVPSPGPLDPDSVLVRMRAVCLNSRHEWKIFSDAYRGSRRCSYPCRPGYPGQEGAGEVVETGPRVNNLKPGDRVVLCGYAGDLHQENIATLQKWALPVTTEKPWAALAPTDLFARVLALLKRGEKIFRANAVVIGLGPAGLAAVLWLRTLGARTITGVDLLRARIETASGLGIDEGILAENRGLLDRLALSRPETVIECTGSAAGIRAALDLAAKETLLLGHSDTPLSLDLSRWMDKNLAVKTQSGFDWLIWEETVNCLNRGLIDPEVLVTHTFPFSADAYTEAMGLIERQEALRIVLTFPTGTKEAPAHETT